MKKPFFSVITLTKNSGKYISKNINSVRNQTFVNYEHIFIDGHSTDESIRVIKKYQDDFPKRIKFYSLAPTGISSGMNKGVEMSSGRYLIHLHADDSFFDNDVLRDVYNWIRKNPDYDWLYGKMCVIEENGEFKGYFPTQLIFQVGWSFILKYYDFIPHQSVFIKKAIFKKYGLFDTNLSSYMDTEFWLRIRNKTKWKFYDRVICRYMLRETAQSSGGSKKAENDLNYIVVKRKYLHGVEFVLVRLFKKMLDWYNTTYR